MEDPATALELIALRRDLAGGERERLRVMLARLAKFHGTLSGWPKRLLAPRATPIVAVYARGTLQGCALERGDGAGGAMLARAFLAAAGPVRDREIAIELSYPRRVRWLRHPDELDVGREGFGLVRRRVAPVLLMPQVAIDHGVDARGMFALLLSKAGLASLPAGARLAAWTVDRVIGRGGSVEQVSAKAARRSGSSDADYAAAWLARMVDRTGAVAFAIDARARILQPDGELWHARSAIAIAALAAHGGHPAAVARARRWLAAEIERALAGRAVARWPLDGAAVVGTLALACLAGVPVHAALRARVAEARASPEWPWHAAQAATALGRDTPPALWKSCVSSLDHQPFAPYVALAARIIGDVATARRAASSVATFVRKTPPHVGGASATRVPETALTAVACHALATTRHHREGALAFVRAHQMLPGRIPAALDPALAIGAFTASPIDHVLRSDITGHALLALLDVG